MPPPVGMRIVAHRDARDGSERPLWRSKGLTAQTFMAQSLIVQAVMAQAVIAQTLMAQAHMAQALSTFDFRGSLIVARIETGPCRVSPAVTLSALPCS
jgi:hypothetical protein